LVFTILRPISLAASTAVGDATAVPVAVVLSCAKAPPGTSATPNIIAVAADGDRNRFIGLSFSFLKKGGQSLDDGPRNKPIRFDAVPWCAFRAYGRGGGRRPLTMW